MGERSVCGGEAGGGGRVELRSSDVTRVKDVKTGASLWALDQYNMSNTLFNCSRW